MGALTSIAYHLHLLHLGSELNANFYTAIVSFATSFVICVVATRLDSTSFCAGSDIIARPVTDAWTVSIPNTLYLLAGLLLACCIILNFLWR
jgi:hypothetical protein